jgi:hypothetical protein
MSDALARLRNRNRPIVPNRDASLTSTIQPSTSLDISTSRHQDLQNSTYLETPISDTLEPEQSSTSLDTSTSRHQDLQNSTYLETPISDTLEPEQILKTKQTTLRLEQGIGDRLQDLCRENSICREVFIEAMFEYSEANPEVLQKILSEATNKNEQRQQIANLKRARSMMERFGS